MFEIAAIFILSISTIVFALIGKKTHADYMEASKERNELLHENRALRKLLETARKNDKRDSSGRFTKI